jgi:UDP-glucose 4-epimerase
VERRCLAARLPARRQTPYHRRMGGNLQTILVTGGSGHLGSAIMRALGAARPIAFDLKKPRGETEFIAGSVLSLSDLEGAMKGVDALVHVAAIPNPRDRPADIVFDTNVRGTWNTFHAAARAGIKKAVLISSECATGLCYQKGEFPPDYLPIDEAYPLRPGEVYGLSKQAAEAVAASFARSGMDVAVLRPLFILFPHHYGEIAGRADLWHRDLWGWVEPDDVAAAVRLALAKVSGFEIFFIGAPNTLAPEPTLELVMRRFGKTIEIRRPELYRDNPHAALFDIAKAQNLLGYAPSSDWRRHLARA